MFWFVSYNDGGRKIAIITGCDTDEDARDAFRSRYPLVQIETAKVMSGEITAVISPSQIWPIRLDDPIAVVVHRSGRRYGISPNHAISGVDPNNVNLSKAKKTSIGHPTSSVPFWAKDLPSGEFTVYWL